MTDPPARIGERRRWLVELGLPLAAFITIASAVFGMVSNQRRGNHELAELETHIIADQLRLRLEEKIGSLQAVVEHMAGEWLSEHRARPAAFRNEANGFLQQFSGFQALSWIDANGIIRIVVPKAGNELALGQDLGRHPQSEVAAALARATTTQGPTRSPVVELLQGGQGFSIYQAVFDSSGRPAGHVAGDFRVTELLDGCLNEADLRQRFRFDIHEEGVGVIYEHRVEKQPHHWPTQFSTPVHVVDRDWSLEIAPTSALLAGTRAETAVLIGGVLLAGAVALLLHLALVRRRARRQSALESHFLLRWSKTLQRATSFNQLAETLRYEVNARLGFEDAWIYVQDSANPNLCSLLCAAGPRSADLGKQAPILRFDGSPLLAGLPLGGRSVVVEDARSDPRVTPEIVTALGARSLIHVPLVLMGERLGFFGTGSFAPDPPRVPGIAELRYLDALAVHVAAAITRIRVQEERLQVQEQKRQLEQQLQKAQKLESLGVLAGGVAHDFNNLLVAILGNADLVSRDLDADAPTRSALDDIVRSAERAADLCRQMLAYSGRGEVAVQPADLSELVRETAHLLEASISDRTELKYHLEPGLPSVEVDVTQIRQVIMNLITNASEAIGERDGIIRVVTGVEHCTHEYLSNTYLDEDLPEGLYVFAEVSDNGRGMEREDKARIFDPFFTTKVAGHGLGLAAVLGIVRGHLGALKVYTELSRGSSFKIILPASDSSAASVPTVPPENRPWRFEGTALVVDDEPSVRALSRRVLEKIGFNVLTASGGAEALQIFRAHASEVDVVLLDLTMPRMSGEETLRELRKLRADVCVLLTSGYNEQEAIDRFKGSALAGFIQKPYRISTLIEKIRDALEPATG